MTDSSQDALIGTVLDRRYRVAERLARGGMSTVYRAVDTRLERDVAMKVLYPHLAEDPELVNKFEREAKMAAALNHPHVVNVYDQGIDVGPEGRLAYLVMEYVPGVTLRTVLGRRPALTPHLTLVYLLALVDGLAAAHKAGMVHRDIKPENVLVSREGDIKVADFGLARATTSHTGTGAALMGTVAYVSPELVSGAQADQRSDVYAVGIMMFEMLTGRQPFTGESAMQVAFQHINGRVPAPSALAPGLAESLDDVVLWCTNPDPENRPLDAHQLFEQLSLLRERLTEAELEYSMPQISDDEATVVLDTSSPSSGDLPTSLAISDDANTATHEAAAPGAPAAMPNTQGEDSDDPATAIYGQLPAEQPRPAPAAAPKPRKPLSAGAARRAARKPTEQLAASRPGKVTVNIILVVMLAAIAQLIGWWLGSSL